MANFKFIYIWGILASLLIACSPAEPDHTKLVVEGWIDADKHPVVMLHSSYSLHDTPPDSTTLLDVLAEHMVLFGKVVLYHETDSVILTGRVDTMYVPPYIYTTTKFKGQEGATYRLKATYKDFLVTSQTTIPSKAFLDSICAIQKENRIIVQAYANGLEIDETYAIFARKTGDKQYMLCPLGVFRANAEQMTIQVRNPLNLNDSTGIVMVNFPCVESSIDIKFAHIEETEFQILSSISSQSMTQGIFFMEAYNNIVSNIVGGNGYWCGMGAFEYTISLEGDSLYHF